MASSSATAPDGSITQSFASSSQVRPRMAALSGPTISPRTGDTAVNRVAGSACHVNRTAPRRRRAGASWIPFRSGAFGCSFAWLWATAESSKAASLAFSADFGRPSDGCDAGLRADPTGAVSKTSSLDGRATIRHAHVTGGAERSASNQSNSRRMPRRGASPPPRARKRSSAGSAGSGRPSPLTANASRSHAAEGDDQSRRSAERSHKRSAASDCRNPVQAGSSASASATSSNTNSTEPTSRTVARQPHN